MKFLDKNLMTVCAAVLVLGLAGCSSSSDDEPVIGGAPDGAPDGAPAATPTARLPLPQSATCSRRRIIRKLMPLPPPRRRRMPSKLRWLPPA